MTRLPSLSGEEVSKVLIKIGFEKVIQRGSHIKLKHADGRTTIIPIHKGESIGRGLMSKILTEVDLSRDNFLSLI